MNFNVGDSVSVRNHNSKCGYAKVVSVNEKFVSLGNGLIFMQKDGQRALGTIREWDDVTDIAHLSQDLIESYKHQEAIKFLEFFVLKDAPKDLVFLLKKTIDEWYKENEPEKEFNEKIVEDIEFEKYLRKVQNLLES